MNVPRVAFQGVHGAFSDEAAAAYFDGQLTSMPCATFAAVAAAVQADAADFGIFPVANSIAGPVLASCDALATGGLSTVGEVVHPIRLHLLGLLDAGLDNVRVVLSHPMALAQCGRFLEQLPHARGESFFDTAGAAEEVRRRRDRTHAALAPHRAADRCHLKILAHDVHDESDNRTRFVIVRRSR